MRRAVFRRQAELIRNCTKGPADNPDDISYLAYINLPHFHVEDSFTPGFVSGCKKVKKL
jgi:hypothetical protein